MHVLNPVPVLYDPVLQIDRTEDPIFATNFPAVAMEQAVAA